MSIFRIVIKNIKQRSLSSLLTILSVMLGVGLVVSILILKQESEQAFNQTATGYELIVGPKGSSLQLTLSTIYQIGSPVQNMPLSVYELLKNDKRVKLAIPYVMGDNYNGFRLIGTVPEIFTHFEYKKGANFKLKEGSFFSKDFEAVIGYETAEKTGLKIGSTFMGSHGIESYEGSEVHEEFNFKVTGILEKTFTPADKIIFTSMNSIWSIHHRESPQGADSISEGHDHKSELSQENSELTITAVLLKLKNPVYFDLVRRQINDNKYEGINAQAVLPIFEIKQLFDIIGNINSILLVIAYLVIFVAVISILVSIYNSMNDRKRDIAIMRSLGAGKFTVLKIIILEGIFISTAGAFLGIITGHAVIFLLKNKISELAGIEISGMTFSNAEIYLFAGTILLGAFVSVLPALKAYRNDVAKNLGQF
ncbi:MAG TPA: ABC transporter permease [Ignavibacteria bacterium]|nr:ABC transporter permease [Ignavibacteria bacterium]